MAIRQYASRWAVDLSKNIVNDGVVYDVDAINQSIEFILSTFFGERMFKLRFGSPLGRVLFSSLNENTGEKLLNGVINAIRRYENRIVILDDESQLILYPDQNAIRLNILYILNDRQITSKFDKKIYL